MSDKNGYEQDAVIVSKLKRFNWRRWIALILSSGILGTGAIVWCFNWTTGLAAAPADIRALKEDDTKIKSDLDGINKRVEAVLADHGVQLTIQNKQLADIIATQRELSRDVKNIQFDIVRILQHFDDAYPETRRSYAPKPGRENTNP